MNKRKWIAVTVLVVWSLLGSMFLLQKVGVLDSNVKAAGDAIQKMWASFTKVSDAKPRVDRDVVMAPQPIISTTVISSLHLQHLFQESDLRSIDLVNFPIPLRI